MKHLLAIAVTLLCVPTLAFAQTEDDKAAVLATLQSWNQGWAEKNVEMAIAAYAEDTDWTNAFGDRFQGREALKEGLEFIFSLDFVMAGDSQTNEYEDIKFLTPDIALLRSKLVRTGQKYPDGSMRPDRYINHLRVYEKRDGAWLIVSHLISQAQVKGNPE